jgi:hypothetical protein
MSNGMPPQKSSSSSGCWETSLLVARRLTDSLVRHSAIRTKLLARYACLHYTASAFISIRAC